MAVLISFMATPVHPIFSDKKLAHSELSQKTVRVQRARSTSTDELHSFQVGHDVRHKATGRRLVDRQGSCLVQGSLFPQCQFLVSGTAAKVNGIIWGFLSFEGS